jgi:hypothetical protein
MPALLPTNWTADAPTPSLVHVPGRREFGDAQWQALSFFLACLFVFPVGVRFLWNTLRRDFPQLPALHYRPALSIVVLWGLCFAVVLTMISGARELMTPGAWKKQGWTYRLSGNASPTPTEVTSEQVRRRGLEQLRFALWQYAARHEGRFPDDSDTSIPSEVWDIPENPGLKYLYRANRTISGVPQLLAFEPDIDRDSRLVLYTTGLIGTMRTEDLERQLADEVSR